MKLWAAVGPLAPVVRALVATAVGGDVAGAVGQPLVVVGVPLLWVAFLVTLVLLCIVSRGKLTGKDPGHGGDGLGPGHGFTFLCRKASRCTFFVPALVLYVQDFSYRGVQNAYL